MFFHSFIQSFFDFLVDDFNDILKLKLFEFIVDNAYIKFFQKNTQNFFEFLFIVELHDFRKFDYYDEKN